MEVKINRGIRNYTEAMFFGLSLRQFIFSALACGVAVGLFFLLRGRFRTETISWMCVLGALPFAVMGSRILQRFTCPEETDRAYKVRFEIKETPCGILLCPEGRAKLRKHPAGIPLCPRCRASN